PVLAVTNGMFQNSAGTVLDGTLASIGADNTASSVVFTSITPPAGLTSNGDTLNYTGTGTSTITATDSVTLNTVFTMHANADGTYVFTQSQLLDLSVLTSDLQSTVGAGGPQPAYFMYTNGLFGSTESAGDWAVRITAPLPVGGQINPSTQGMGVN